MLRRLLLPLLLFAAFAAHAAPLARELRGGHFATLTLDPKFIDGNAEEWEAFLSVDGGRFYSVRLTPHLDIALRSYDVLVPNVESNDVRLLIRTGNERVEVIHSIPGQFRIHADPDAALPLSSATHAHAPEAARPGEAKVVVWSDGARVHASSSIPTRCRAAIADASHAQWPNVVPPTATLANSARLVNRATAQPRNPATTPRNQRNILLLSMRMNV